MADKVKLTWEFRGPDAAQTAEHYLRHLVTYAEKQGLAVATPEMETVNPYFSLVHLVLPKDESESTIRTLRPRQVVEVEE